MFQIIKYSKITTQGLTIVTGRMFQAAVKFLSTPGFTSQWIVSVVVYIAWFTSIKELVKSEKKIKPEHKNIKTNKGWRFPTTQRPHIVAHLPEKYFLNAYFTILATVTYPGRIISFSYKANSLLASWLRQRGCNKMDYIHY